MRKVADFESNMQRNVTMQNLFTGTYYQADWVNFESLFLHFTCSKATGKFRIMLGNMVSISFRICTSNKDLKGQIAVKPEFYPTFGRSSYQCIKSNLIR